MYCLYFRVFGTSYAEIDDDDATDHVDEGHHHSDDQTQADASTNIFTSATSMLIVLAVVPNLSHHKFLFHIHFRLLQILGQV